jgi:hypothetical protein
MFCATVCAVLPGSMQHAPTLLILSDGVGLAKQEDHRAEDHRAEDRVAEDRVVEDHRAEDRVADFVTADHSEASLVVAFLARALPSFFGLKL